MRGIRTPGGRGGRPAGRAARHAVSGDKTPMRAALPALLLALGFLGGYLVRGLRIDPHPERAPVRTAPAPLPETPPPPPPAAPAEAAPSPPAPPAAAETAKAPEAETGGDELAEMMRAQVPAMKSYAGAQARERAQELLKSLGLDPGRADRLAKALADDAARQMEAAFRMVLGEGELDPAVLASFQGAPAMVSAELERELASFLGTAEIVAVRDHVRRQHEKQQEQMVEMQVGMLDIPDLSPEQDRRVRELFRGSDSMEQDTLRFAELMRKPGKTQELLTEEGLRAEMARQLEPRRERMRAILTPPQMERYAAYEARLFQQAALAMRMWGGFSRKRDQPSSGAR